MHSPIAAEFSNDVWTEHEFSELDLGDKRRSGRLKRMTKSMLQSPKASLPTASGDKASIKANYRCLHNSKMDFDEVLYCHQDKTVGRMSQELERRVGVPDASGEPGVFLAVQDTTQLDFTAHGKTGGLGVLQTPECHGILLHTTLAVTECGTVLGILAQQQWVRAPEAFGKRHQRKRRPIKEKESNKWLEGVKSIAHLSERLPGQTIITVADREADIYEFFALSRPEDHHLLVRACHNRKLMAEELNLWPFMEAREPAGAMVVEVPGGHGKKARQATLTVRHAPVQLKGSQESPVTLWAVYVREEAPARESGKGLSWMLLSSLPVTTPQLAQRCVLWYTRRWRVEMFHRILKSGCNVEECKLADAESLMRYITLQSIVATRVLYCTTTGREHPDQPCTDLLSEDEWTVLFCIIHKTGIPPKKPPKLGEAVIWIARLGGYMEPKGKHPGAQTIQRGFERLADLILGYNMLKNAKAGIVGS
jgi:hypothetical protein